MFFKNICCLLLAFSVLACTSQAFAGPNANATVSIDLIADGGAGNQRDDGVTSGTVSGQGTKIAVEVFAKGVTTPLPAVVIKFDFDASVLKVAKVENSAFSPILDDKGATFLALSPVTLPPSGFLARAEFSTVTDVTGRAFTLGIATISLQASSTSKDDVTTTDVISFNANNTNLSPDFDGNGVVGIPDFLQFVDHFGTSRGDAGYDAKYDLDGNGAIGIPDFLIFVNSFGSQVPPSGGGGGGSPDLVVESPSVSDSTLTTGQSFTLSATVRNQGTGASASTTLRYYQSSDATISTSDTEVGTDSVGGLSASGTSAESISLNAPSSAGTYYYGACVNSVTGESDTGNNCSDAVTVTVSSSGNGSGGGGGGTPPPSGDAVTGTLTECSGERLGSNFFSVTMKGTVQAHRSVLALRITGYVNGEWVGVDLLNDMSAGQSQDFSISGSISTSASTLTCSVRWDGLVQGSKSQGVVDER